VFCTTTDAVTLPREQRQALAAIAARVDYELIPSSKAQEKAVDLPAASGVTITASPELGLEATLRFTEWLAARGHDAVPHLPARMIRDRAQLAEIVARLHAAAIRRVFVLGGDATPCGDFPDGVTLLRALADTGHPFEEIGIAAYPEGHAQIPEAALVRGLQEKQQRAHIITTQMAFNPDTVSSWIARLRREGVTLPLRLGVPGAVKLTTLMKAATNIGLADSAHYLLTHRGLLGHLVQRGSFGPDAFLLALAPTLADPAADVRGLHVLTFNQVRTTVAWQRRMLGELAG
jgi:methylenetetrahydrofolate reductase (NADPH)